ncbi:MAG: pyridoxamine 5'-phosphate oxidase family protein [Fusobacteriaceae bacterium]
MGDILQQDLKKIEEKGRKIIENSKSSVLATLGDDGYPIMKAMLMVGSDGLKTIWFSTNTSSRKMKRISNEKRSGVYFFDSNIFEGLMLSGDIEIIEELETKKKFWVNGFEMYYPQGFTDPDYSLLKFTTKKVSFYSNFSDTVFDI